jgi:Flp pilus assembly protein TadG
MWMQFQGRSDSGPIALGARQRRPAIAAVEMAMVAPLLGMIVIGMFELSRGVQVKETLSNAARKGCRTGIQRTTASIDVYNDAVNIMRDNGFDSTLFNPATPGAGSGSYIGFVNIVVTGPDGTTYSDALGAPSGSQISVQVGIPVSSVAWVTSFFLQPTVLESETVIMMKQ